jgi:hypothetical protein
MVARLDPGLAAGLAPYAPTGHTNRPAENRRVEPSEDGRFPDSRADERPSLLSQEGAVLELVRSSAKTFADLTERGERAERRPAADLEGPPDPEARAGGDDETAAPAEFARDRVDVYA